MLFRYSPPRPSSTKTRIKTRFRLYRWDLRNNSPRPSSTKTRIKTFSCTLCSHGDIDLRDHPPLEQGLRLIIALTSAMKSLSPKPSLKKLPGAKNLDLYTKPLAPGNIFYSPSADSCPCRVHKFLFPNTPKNIRMYHPNFHEIIGRVTNFYVPTGHKKKGITSNA